MSAPPQASSTKEAIGLMEERIREATGAMERRDYEVLFGRPGEKADSVPVGDTKSLMVQGQQAEWGQKIDGLTKALQAGDYNTKPSELVQGSFHPVDTDVELIQHATLGGSLKFDKPLGEGLRFVPRKNVIVPDLTKMYEAKKPSCTACQVELCGELDAYYGRDSRGKSHCSGCRRKLRIE